MSPSLQPFELTGVVHLVRPVGTEVHDLSELLRELEHVPERSLFFHTAGRLLRHPSVDELPPDDLSGWVAGVVQDRETAERMSFAVDSCGAPDDLRRSLIQVLESVPEKERVAHDAPPGGDFTFLTAESVPIPSGMDVHSVPELAEALAVADPSVWFYHLVEEPWPRVNDRAPLDAWLRARGATPLAEFLEQVARSGRPLEDMRTRALRRWRLNRIGQRIAAASGSTEKERIEAGRAAVSNLVRRIQRPGEGS